MDINSLKRGYALLIAVIFMSVLLALGLTITALGYKQSVLASSATESQYAFYAADAALDCVLSADQITEAPGTSSFLSNPFSYETHGMSGVLECDPASIGGTSPLNITYTETCFNIAGKCENQRVTTFRIPLAYQFPGANLSNGETPGNETRCADVTVYKTANNPAGGTQVYAQGYDVPCGEIGTNARVTVRGLQATY